MRRHPLLLHAGGPLGKRSGVRYPQPPHFSAERCGGAMNDGVRWQAHQELPVGLGIEPAQQHQVALIAALALWTQEAKPIRMEMEWRGDGVEG